MDLTVFKDKVKLNDEELKRDIKSLEVVFREAILDNGINQDWFIRKFMTGITRYSMDIRQENILKYDDEDIYEYWIMIDNVVESAIPKDNNNDGIEFLKWCAKEYAILANEKEMLSRELYEEWDIDKLKETYREKNFSN